MRSGEFAAVKDTAEKSEFGESENVNQPAMSHSFSTFEAEHPVALVSFIRM